jgi:hypothetical protein
MMSEKVNPPLDEIPENELIDDEALTAEVIDESELIVDEALETEIVSEIEVEIDVEEQLPEPDKRPTMPREPEKPEWKRKIEEIHEQRQAQKAEMVAKRKEDEIARLATKAKYQKELQSKRKSAEQQRKTDWDTREKQKQALTNEMVQAIREERENKRREREEMDAKLKKEREEEHYAKPQDSQNEQPEQESNSRTKISKDLDSRLSRLSKKEDD